MEERRGTKANQAKNSRSKLGKERMRRIPETKHNKKSLLFMPKILRNKTLFFKVEFREALRRK